MTKALNFQIDSQVGDGEERERERRARMIKMESLMKELEGLMKQDGKELISNDNPVCPVLLVFYTLKYSMFHCFSCSFTGLSFLTPVIGFYCQKCEEFIGDLNSADNHAAIHYSNHSSVSILPICADIFFSISLLSTNLIRR